MVALVGIFPPQHSWTTEGREERERREGREERERVSAEGGGKTDMRRLIGYWAAVGSVAAGLIYTLRDIKNDKDKMKGLGTMNKKQTIFMWIGLIVFIFFLLTFSDRDHLALSSKSVLLSVILVTVGLIYTFRDKKDKSD